MLVALGLAATGTALVAGGQATKTTSAPDQAAPVGASSGRREPVPAADGRLEIRAVAGATGRPIEGAAVEWQLRVNNGRSKTTNNSTNRDGRAVLECPRRRPSTSCT